MKAASRPRDILANALEFVRPSFVQVAAMCVRQGKDGPEVLLIQTLTRKLWMVPKGWPMDGLSLSDAAAQEAWEEAGVARSDCTNPAWGVQLHQDQIKRLAGAMPRASVSVGRNPPIRRLPPRPRNACADGSALKRPQRWFRTRNLRACWRLCNQNTTHPALLAEKHPPLPPITMGANRRALQNSLQRSRRRGGTVREILANPQQGP